MRTCLIYGQNGLDLDVTLNLESLYRKLGFRVFFSSRLYGSDLLVVTRAINEPANISDFNYRQIHVYDYTGWDYTGFLRATDHAVTFIFTTDPGRTSQLTGGLGFPAENIFQALPPVDTSLWSNNPGKVKYGVTHIGNFKIIDSTDTIRVKFNEVAGKFNIHVWGSGWKDMVNYHGKAPLFRVSSIYSRSEYALGLMYPFQRKNTFSGRFWHAPLNGCTLLSEEAFYADKIPGVIPTDYSVADVQAKLLTRPDRKHVQQMAVKFWNEQFEKTSGYVRVCLAGAEWGKSHPAGKFRYYRIRLFNLVIRVYQKLGISALVIRK